MEYRYAVVRHQPTLDVATAENFAVLVEGHLPTGSIIFAVGRQLEPSRRISYVGNAVASRVSEIIPQLVAEAVQNRSSGEDVLDWLAGTMVWNYQVTTPQPLEDSDPIHKVAFKLFAEHVAGANILLETISRRSTNMLRAQASNERVGETFQTAVPIGDELSFAAD